MVVLQPGQEIARGETVRRGGQAVAFPRGGFDLISVLLQCLDGLPHGRPGHAELPAQGSAGNEFANMLMQ